MSELKAYKMVNELYCTDSPSVIPAEVYFKSDADKVFRRLKTRLAHKGISNQRLEADKNNNWRKYCAAMAELRHSNSKRCLAMADMNWWQANRYSAAEMVERIRGNFEEATQCSKLEEKYLKRYNKWLALAEEPTWAKFLQLIHKEAK